MSIEAERAHLTLGGSILDCPRLYQFYERRIFTFLRDLLSRDVVVHATYIRIEVKKKLHDLMRVKDVNLEAAAQKMYVKGLQRIYDPQISDSGRFTDTVYRRRAFYAFGKFLKFHNLGLDRRPISNDTSVYSFGRAYIYVREKEVMLDVNSMFMRKSIMLKKYFYKDRFVLGIFRQTPDRYIAYVLNKNFKTHRVHLTQEQYDSLTPYPVARAPFKLDTDPRPVVTCAVEGGT